jgi:hypothetical protein
MATPHIPDRRVLRMADLTPEERAVINALIRLKRARERKQAA